MKRIAIALALTAALAACSDSADDEETSETTEITESETEENSSEETTTASSDPACEEKAAQFYTKGSANADLDDPVSEATCQGDVFVVTANGIPDYTYIETSPGQPRDQNISYEIPANPTPAAEKTEVPRLGQAAVTLGGIPIYGPTEGTGGDVESLPGILSECGSHNGPTGFHLHLLGTSSETDCIFTPEEVASGPQLLGYAFDGYPIYSGNDQYTSSWELTDESLFATDTWSAHTYVEGSGDLDQCNGLLDDDGSYAYYTTDTFPYILGCYYGEVDLTGNTPGGGEGGDRPERPEGEERPEPPTE